MRRKKTFILLEIVIGFTLVMLAILPFLRYPFRYMRRELEMLFEAQLTRVAQERLCALERQIYQHDVDESFLFKKKTAVYSTAVVSIKLSDGWERRYTEKVKLIREGQKKSEDGGHIYSLVHIKVFYEGRGFKAMEFYSEMIVKKKV